MKKIVQKRILGIIHFLRNSEGAFLLVFAVLAGIGAGYGAVIFRWLINSFKFLFFDQGHILFGFMGKYYIIIIPALGGLIVGLMIYFLAKETKGHGVPEVMLSVALLKGKIRFRVALVKALVSSICIGSGGAVGREGPIVQIGSSLGSSIGQIFNLSKNKIRILVACGAGGGIAATFNTPLAGIFFALEVILRDYAPRHVSSVVLSSVVATVISRHYLGNHPAFITPHYEILNISEFAFYILFGFVTAGIAFLFIKTLYKTEDIFDKINIPDYLKPALGGILIGVIGLYYPQIFGVGYETIGLALNGKMLAQIALVLVGLKLIATSLSLGSGGSGGIFAPSLFIGAMSGIAFSKLTYLIAPGMAIPPGAGALVGMGGVFAAAAQAPVTAILIMFEMTGDYKIILPLMTVVIIATIIVKQLSKESIYTEKIVRKGIDIQNIREANLLEVIKVSEAMQRNIITVHPETPVRNAGLLIKNTHHRGFPVIDHNNHLIGVVTYNDINERLKQGRGDDPVREILTHNLIVCHPDETLRMSLEKMGEKNIGRIPVVDPAHPEIMLGLITRKNIIKACNVAIHEVKELREKILME